MDKTKTQVLNAIQSYSIADMECKSIRSDNIVRFARELAAGPQPQTAANYLSHLGAGFSIARPARNYALDPVAMTDALKVKEPRARQATDDGRTQQFDDLLVGAHGQAGKCQSNAHDYCLRLVLNPPT